MLGVKTFYDAIILLDDGSIKQLDQVDENTLINMLRVGFVDADIRYHEHNATYSNIEHYPWLVKKTKVEETFQ